MPALNPLLLKPHNEFSMRLRFPSLILAALITSNVVAEDLKSASMADVIQWLLAHPERLEAIPFPDVVAATCGKKVIPMDAQNATAAAILKHVQTMAAVVMKQLNAADSPVKGLRRINEASRYFEDLLVKQLTNETFRCQFPKNVQGDGQRSGYPDLELIHLPTGTVTYIDPKLYEETSRTSTLRTFYFEPKGKTNKITQDAHHLLLGFAHDGKDGAWSFTSVSIVDISKLKVRLKAEFDASNKEVYQPENLLPQK
jgi:hypothetical protein